MEVKFELSVSVVAAVVLGEILSTLWYSDSTPWGRYGSHRFFIAAILSDIGLAFLLQFLMKKYYSIHNIEDAAWLAMWLTLIYTCLEAPHHIHHSDSCSRFFYHVLHKFAILFVMVFALFYFRHH